MKKIKWNVMGYIILFVIAGALLYHMCQNSMQAAMSFVIGVDFVGEYRQGDNDWKPLDADTRLSAFDGDVILRGQLSEPLFGMVSFYLNHIGVSVMVNGELITESGRITDAVPKEMCGSYWGGWTHEGEEPIKEIEIRLHNPHHYGNANAFNQFLDSLHLGGGEALSKHLNAESMPYQLTGSFVMLVSIAVLGTALGYFAQRLPSAGILCSAGLLSLFMGIYIWMDTVDIEFRSRTTIFNTGVRQLCIMFATLQLVAILRQFLTGKREKVAGVMLALLGTANGILLLCSLADLVTIYDTGIYWAVAQGLVSVVMLALSFCEYRTCSKRKKVFPVSCMALLACVIMELVDAYTGWWTSGIVVKVVFILLFIFHIVEAVILIIDHQKDSEKAKELEKELRNSRIVLAMSQIRTHFVFNFLTAISGLCGYDPEKADQALITFSRYLRSNIDIMQEDEPELFSRSLEQLEDYIALEQLRFGDRIQFVTDLEVTGFKLPPLILQPIVENAIKHGLFPKTEGGTILLFTRMEGDNIMITVTDDGVGFDTKAPHREGAVGLDNVRFRLEHMVNGTMNIESSPGKGTTVTMVIPCRQNKGSSGII
ncbi:MAG: histidine kinase [Lachnospiraceae bacterium]|nr:histidine kinase [Lachnospiraceae bacterium]